MGDDTPHDDPAESETIATDPADSIDLEHTEQVRIGVSRGETDLELGPPRDYPDRADLTVRPESADGSRVVLSVDAMAGDHGMGHADVELTPAEARALRDRLEAIVRSESDDGGSTRD